MHDIGAVAYLYIHLAGKQTQHCALLPVCCSSTGLQSDTVALLIVCVMPQDSITTNPWTIPLSAMQPMHCCVHVGLCLIVWLLWFC